jgi:hypothetical protein
MSRSADRAAPNANYGSRISNSPATNSTPKLLDYSLYTATTLEKQHWAEYRGTGLCFNSGQNWHFVNKCPQKQPNPSAVQGVNQIPNRSTDTTTPARQNQVCAHVNHVAMEEAQIAPDVILV